MNEFVDRLGDLSEQKQRLLKQLMAAKAKGADAARLTPRPADAGPLPLSHAQRGLWFLSRLAPESSFYHMPYGVHLSGALDVAALERAFNRIVERHEALRTGFPDRGGKPVQRVIPALTLPLPVIDLARTPPSEREAAALRMASEESLRPFDLAAGPLFRVALYRLGTDEHLLMFSMHHIISDGWSIGLMMQELGLLYEAFRHGLPDPLGTPPVQYADYALWQQRRIDSGALEPQLAYWRERLTGVTPLELTTDRPRPPVQGYRGASETVAIPEAVTAALEALAARRDTTLFTTLLAAFKALLFLHSGTRRVVVGTPVANRPPETASLIGFFANTLALVTDCGDDPTFATLMARVRETTLGAFAHQEVPFEMVVEALGVERDPSRNPLFQVMFGLQSVAMREFGLPGLTASSRTLDNDTTHFDMELHLWHRERHLGGYLSYNVELFRRDTVLELLERFQALLVAVVGDPECSLGELAAAAGIDPQALSPAARTEATLLAHPSLEDCVVVERPCEGRTERVAYVVPSRPLDLEALRRSLPLPPVALVPLSAIPRDDAGRVDREALAALPVIDDGLIQRWQQALAETEGVTQVRVSVEEISSPRPWLHLSELYSEAPVMPPPAPSAVAEPSVISAPAAVADGGPLELPADAPRTLTAALLRSAERYPERGLTLVQDGGEGTLLSYPELVRNARALLAGLQAQGLQAGDRVILQFSDLADHFTAFWACALGGIVPVTVALAPSYRERCGVVNKLWNVWQLLHRPPLLTDDTLAPQLAGLPALFGEVEDEFRVLPVAGLRGDPQAAHLHQADPEEVLFLQLTSGSTGVPKCVQETHRAIVHHIHGSQRFNGYTEEDVTLNWLPLDHVVPILTCHLKDTYLGLRQVQVATREVLAEPLRWLDLIEAHRVTHSWAPNFGFKLVVDGLTRAAGRRWDLSSMRYFMNAGEQVTRAVVEAFLRRLAPFGVGAQVMQPAFGMAEVATCMTYRNGFSAAEGVHRVRKSSLLGSLQEAGEGEGACVAFVDLGPPMPGVQIRIADQHNETLPERVIGRLQIRGPVVMPGYLDNPEANAEAFVGDGWFDSGDLGFLHHGSLALTGRVKETIIIRGANFYCYEVEEVVNGVDGVEPTFSAACAVEVAGRGGEGLALFFVPRGGGDGVDPQLVRRIRGEVSRQLGVAADFIVPLARAEFPKTTSGKIQRTRLKQGLEGGEFADRLKAVDLAERNANGVPDWFFRRGWRRQPLRAGRTAPATGSTLIFADERGLAERLAATLGEVVRVEAGERFECLGPRRYRIDPRRAEDYTALLAAVAADGRKPGRILHLWSYGAPLGDQVEDLDGLQRRGVYSVLFLVQALAGMDRPEGGVALSVVSNRLQPVAEGEPVAWGHGALPGLLRSVGRELPWIVCRHLDLTAEAIAADADCVARELVSVEREPEVAYRDDERWLPHLERAPLGGGELPLRRGGIYLLSGGLGGIGQTLARYLAERWQARLVLVGRRPLASPHNLEPADQPFAEEEGRAATLAALNELGGEVRYVAADIGDGPRMAAVKAAMERRWGAPLDGIFHLAGSFPTRALAEESAASLADGLHAKVEGSRVLHRLAPPGALFVHVASVNGLFGGAMAGAYSAANRFAQTFAHFQRGQGLRAHCLAFSLWDEVGMSRGYALKEQSRAQGFLPIDAQRGLRSLLAGLAADQSQLLIGLDGEKANIRHHLRREWRPVGRLRAHLVGAVPAERPALLDRYGVPCPCELTAVERLASERTADGGAADGQVQPATELQRTIAAIWREVLGLSSVGLRQNFFELGGQSLALVQVHSRLQEALGREIPVVELLQHPTVGALAAALAPAEGAAATRGATFDAAAQRANRQRASRQRRATTRVTP
ncbi:condensation domain-containing protein [Endothiovibrio diazotrophicus]